MRCPVRARGVPRTAALFAALAIALVSGCAHHGAPPAGEGVVERVVDGDTVVLDLPGGAEKVRLIGIDTPETVKPNTPVQCYGPEASAHTKHLLPRGTQVLVKRDAEARDHFGRLLLYIWRKSDDRFVNLDLATGGFARPLAIPPNTAHDAQFEAAVDQARSAGRGLWGRCGGR
ncbi:MAG: thermonuclease family protein [Acidimicrobiia bacterium]|nr:thermonuclease family protein [Acidimicrobiia bacterium]